VYYEPQPPKGPSGCLELWVLTRAAFGVLLWPLVALMAALFGILAIIYLFTISPPLALIPIAVIVAGVVAFARWEQRHFRPPGT
jgi:uncharacterized membrane protein